MTTPNFMRNDVKCHVAAGASPAFICNRGFAGVVRMAQGHHRLTITEKIPLSSMVLQVSADATAKAIVTCKIVDERTIDVRTWEPGLIEEEQDINFFLTVERVGF